MTCCVFISVTLFLANEELEGGGKFLLCCENRGGIVTPPDTDLLKYTLPPCTKRKYVMFHSLKEFIAHSNSPETDGLCILQPLSVRKLYCNTNILKYVSIWLVLIVNLTSNFNMNQNIFYICLCYAWGVLGSVPAGGTRTCHYTGRWSRTDEGGGPWLYQLRHHDRVESETNLCLSYKNLMLVWSLQPDSTHSITQMAMA